MPRCQRADQVLSDTWADCGQSHTRPGPSHLSYNATSTYRPILRWCFLRQLWWVGVTTPGRGSLASSSSTQWESGHDETVEVNQRALIDKVLARYSGEFTVFRELLQNSDDAQSKAVEIRFETLVHLDRDEGEGTRLEKTTSPLAALLPDLKTTTVSLFTPNVDSLTTFDRCTNGPLRTTVSFFGKKTGIGLRR